MASLSTWFEMLEPAAFRLCGFVMGDWRTLVLRAGFEVLAFRAFLANSWTEPVVLEVSRSISMGEFEFRTGCWN
jgi:hypothetical protein